MKQLTTARLYVAGLVVLAVAVLVSSYFIARTPSEVLDGDILSARDTSGSRGNVEYSLEPGKTASQIGEDLQGLGVIRSARQFQVLASLMGLQDKLSAGDYTLARGSSTATILSQLTVREVVPVLRVTFPEGIRVEEMATIAARAGFGTAEEFLAAVEAAVLPPEFEESLPRDDPRLAGYALQGYLFPDTYILPVGSTMADLVQLMIETMEERFSPELRAAALANGLNPHQALTLAAIVEREAVLSEERPLIAGVFYNRIAEGDLIGADPTTQFAAALDPASVERYGWWKKELTIDDLENPSPYNTRLIAGLPPGPIASPSLASIQAVANPEKTDYYYFVADAKKGDGSHVFARTLAEHERNQVLYGQ
jgi:UPF0755 protein